jgi:carbonic anhydrase
MRLLEAIIEANHRAVAGERAAGVALQDYAEALPVVALTCIDVRLNHLLPNVLGLPEEHFIWLRNAGNIITGPLSSTMRSLALACAIKGGREIAVIGHTDCKAGQTTITKLTDAFQALGIERLKLPANLIEFFGLFASERQNILQGVAFIRASPLIGPRVPVHGLLLDLANGRVDWVINGYETLGSVAAKLGDALRHQVEAIAGGLAQFGGLSLSGLSLPTAPIGEVESIRSDIGTPHPLAEPPSALPPPASAPAPPTLPTPKLPPVLPKPHFLQPWKRQR